MNLADAIKENARRQARFAKAERTLRAIRLRVFDYEDAGKSEQAERIMEKLKERLKPLWEARAHASQQARLSNYQM